MELKKVYQTDNKENVTREVHEGWFDGRLRFTVHVYNDGSLHIGVCDYKTGGTVLLDTYLDS